MQLSRHADACNPCNPHLQVQASHVHRAAVHHHHQYSTYTCRAQHDCVAAQMPLTRCKVHSLCAGTHQPRHHPCLSPLLAHTHAAVATSQLPSAALKQPHSNPQPRCWCQPLHTSSAQCTVRSHPGHLSWLRCRLPSTDHPAQAACLCPRTGTAAGSSSVRRDGRAAGHAELSASATSRRNQAAWPQEAAALASHQVSAMAAGAMSRTAAAPAPVNLARSS